jgi:DNA polymerase-3 subunit alpha
MLKLDVLGIRNLDVISATEKIVYERTGERVDAETASDDPDDPDPLARARARAGWQLIAEGRTAGVFQLESAGMTELAQKVAPTSIEELSAIVALFRPGPLGARTHEHYANRRGGREPVDYGIFTDDPAETEVIAGLLGDTYGLMIYQEQMMRVAQAVAGFDAIGRDRLRKAIGKKLPAEMAAVGAAFIEGAVADHDVEGRPKLAFKRTTAEALWHGMENAAAYAFNACLTGDTVLQTGSQTTWTIAELYRKLTTIDTSGPTCGWCNKQLSVGQYVVRGLCKGCYAWHRKFHGSIGLTLLAYDFTDGRLRPARVKDVHLSGIQPVWKITLADGRTVTATANHRFMAADGWRQVRHLSVGDALVVDGGYEKQQYDPSYRTTRGKRNPTGHGKPWKYGKENCGYVDGGFIAFQEWTRSTRDNATCAVCGKVDGRLERAHLDGNRANNDPSNLRWLCVSHHKQHDYRVNGRRHRWDKGHVADKSEIVSIEPAGLAQTYDVEMDDEGHNFTANGIVSHNSHSVGYAKLAWETAWLKANWPAAFGAGLLSVTGADDRRTSILRSLAADGIAVSTPDVNLGEVHTTLGADGVVRLGIGEIKGMRHDDAVAIVAERSRAGAFSTFADFLARVRLSTGSVRALVEAGACDGFGPRSGLVRAMRVAGVSDVATPDTEWSVVERAARERGRLGVTLSSNPLKVLTDQLRQWRSPHTQHAPVPLHRIGERCRNGEIVSTIGVVASFEIVKKGRRRAKLVLEGSAGSMDCIVWSDQLQAIEHEGSVPVAGAVVGVDARVRQTTIPLPADLDEHADEPDEETDAAAPGLTTKTELEIRYIWTASLDDRPRLLRDAKSQVNGKIGADRKAGAQEFT